MRCKDCTQRKADKKGSQSHRSHKSNATRKNLLFPATAVKFCFQFWKPIGNQSCLVFWHMSVSALELCLCAH